MTIEMQVITKNAQESKARNTAHKILVVGPGKVGTSSIQGTIVSNGYIYYNNRERLSTLPNCIINKCDSVVQLHDIDVAADIYHQLLYQTDEKIFVFLGSREMMKREISAFFQIDPRSQEKREDNDYLDLDVDELIQKFNEFVPENEVYVKNYLHDFCDQMGIPTNIMEDSCSAVQQNGYHIFKMNDRASFIFYRLEDLNQSWTKICEESQFNRINPAMPIHTYNTCEEKTIAIAYKEFLKVYKPPYDFIDSIFSYDLNKFYTDDYVESQKKYWRNR